MNLAEVTTGRTLQALFVSFIIAILSAILATHFAIRIDLLDRPNAEPHKQHKRPVPISGGTALFATLLIALLIFRKNISQNLWKVTIGAAVIFVFAFIDDKKSLNWRYKLAGQVGAGLLLIIFGVRTHLFEGMIFQGRFPLWLCQIADYAVTLLWVVFITNAYNLVDSADGLMLGLSSWTFGFFIIAALDAGQRSLALYCSIFLGGTLALSFFNANPALLFMGDSGAQVIGFVLANVGILYTPPSMLLKNTWFLPILMLGVPIFDTTLVMISRWRKGQHFYHSGTDHTYHRLLQMGLSIHQASSFMHLTCFALQSLAFFAISQSVIEANLIFGSVVLCGVGAIFFFESEKLWKIVTKYIQYHERLH